MLMLISASHRFVFPLSFDRRCGRSSDLNSQTIQIATPPKTMKQFKRREPAVSDGVPARRDGRAPGARTA